jgi:hypothetical protein
MAPRGHDQRLEVLGISRAILDQGDGQVFDSHVHNLALVIACDHLHQ